MEWVGVGGIEMNFASIVEKASCLLETPALFVIFLFAVESRSFQLIEANL